MSPTGSYDGNLFGRFPRVSGDEPHLIMDVADHPVFSPRERG